MMSPSLPDLSVSYANVVRSVPLRKLTNQWSDKGFCDLPDSEAEEEKKHEEMIRETENIKTYKTCKA